jgi:hypothetical protein
MAGIARAIACINFSTKRRAVSHHERTGCHHERSEGSRRWPWLSSRAKRGICFSRPLPLRRYGIREQSTGIFGRVMIPYRLIFAISTIPPAANDFSTAGFI